MTDLFKHHARGLSSPAENAVAIVPDDAADLATAPRALFVGQGGDLALTLLGGDTVTFGNVPAGSLLPVRAIRVRASGTTAARILGLW
ncbi:spike base protein, RCAP_Rcc01079 family [Amaricoccus solimangrovi]|uniref:Uncharacterized protein n=1 Tax=Amaricoccus solimangrovi TaxID=2589815 RepID=A0A501WEY7_9RHOB|nr:hypothetical protein [Amaricoccus solimangrovi]TPE48413.1 hypothetical protein FJM51_17775 [Amaricoccus solimangrovi]